MIFNINAALLDAPRTCDSEKEDTHGYEITRVLKTNLMYRNSLYILPLADCKRTIVSKFYDKEYLDENRRYLQDNRQRSDSLIVP